LRPAPVIRTEIGHRLVNAAMRYLLVGVVLASLAGLHVVHELESGEAPGAAVCMAPEAQRGALRDALLQHLRSH
jgi:hypothetical protein